MEKQYYIAKLLKECNGAQKAISKRLGKKSASGMCTSMRKMTVSLPERRLYTKAFNIEFETNYKMTELFEIIDKD